MKRLLIFSLLVTLTMATPLLSQADDTVDLLKEAIGLVQAGNYTEAREVVAIALDQIDHQLLDTTAALFPQSIGGFTRDDVGTQKAMGIEITEATYRSNTGDEIKVQLMGGGGGVLGNIADLGASFGGGRKVRIQGRSGTAMDDGGENSIMLKLKSGKSLSFTSSGLEIEAVTSFAEAFPVKEVDESGS